MRSQLHRSDESIRSHIIRNGVHHVFAHLSTMSPVYTPPQPPHVQAGGITSIYPALLAVKLSCS
jgi:hypothetical protein